MQTGNIFVLISYYLKTIIYVTGPETTEQKFVNQRSVKKFIWALYLVCYLFCLQWVYL